MPQVRYAPEVIRDLQRLREFLRPLDPVAAKRASERIRNSLQVLGHQPHIGRPIEELPDEFREWVIEFGDNGYLVRYRIDADSVTILSMRHQKEAGFY